MSLRRQARLSQVLFAVVALSTLVAAQSNPLFSTLSLNPVGSGPVAIASGVFNPLYSGAGSQPLTEITRTMVRDSNVVSYLQTGEVGELGN